MSPKLRACGAVFATVVVAASAGCGSNVPRAEIREAAGLGPTGATAAAATSPAGSASADTPGGAAPAAGSTEAAPVAGAPASGGSAAGSAAGAATPAGNAAPNAAVPTKKPASSSSAATAKGPAASGGGSRSAAANPGAAPGGATVATGCPAPCGPLVIGSVGTWSGIVGQNVVGGLNALRSWVASTNAAGGLGGHQVRLEVADDGTDPARHRALVQEFVERRGVMAFVYNAAVFSGQASVEYLNAHKIPVVGGSGTEPWYTTSPMFFTQIIAGEVAIEATTASYARSAKAANMTKMGLVTCSDGVQVCEDTARSVPRYASKYGVQLAYQGKASLAAPDFTANCLAARNAGVQILYLALDANSYQRFGRSCASVDYHPKYGVAQPVMLAELARDPNLQGSPGVSYTAPFFYDANPAIAEFHRAMSQYAAGAALTGSASLGWSAAKLLQAAARRLSAIPTSADILEGVWALNGEDLGGLTAPLRFRRDGPTVPPVCYWQVVVADNSYKSPDNGTRHCEQ
ncbi:MAG TPA: ABC transporter substrate-binding protein [Acidimicrobiia bacterium]|nr:ABC transporter substrate-binding protein [Acidimicrobiia bacterium]